MFVWTDIETTGLDDRQDAILSLGMIVTTDDFREVARAEWDIGGTRHEVLCRMNEYVRNMHTKSGLLARCEGAPYAPTVEQSARNWLVGVLGAHEPVMAGNSVHFDMRFLRTQMPSLVALMHYRLLDVSTLKVLCLATVPGAVAWEGARKSAAHTPLADLEESLAELAHWRAVLRGAPCL